MCGYCLWFSSVYPSFTWPPPPPVRNQALLPEWSADDLSRCLWCIVCMRVRPGEEWMAALEEGESCGIQMTEAEGGVQGGEDGGAAGG